MYVLQVVFRDASEETKQEEAAGGSKETAKWSREYYVSVIYTQIYILIIWAEVDLVCVFYR